jgi:hypothetical protein
MATTIFTPDFYKELYNGLMNKSDSFGFNHDKAAKGEFISEDYEFDNGLYVTCEVQYDTDTEGSAPFDAPWDETYKTVFVGIAGLVDVRAYESTDRDSKEIEGFDYDAFFKANK